MICKPSVLLGISSAVLLTLFLVSWRSSSKLLFTERTLLIEGEQYLYQVFVPPNWNAERQWPVILFLHGAGERGRDGIRQTEVGIGPAIRRGPDRFPAIVVMPQCRRGLWWNDQRMERMVMAILERSVEDFSGDHKRVYLTGISMGGYGTFYLSAEYPEKFAALAPVCGGVVLPYGDRKPVIAGPGDPYLGAARRIGMTPIWMFHGSADAVVPVSESRQISAALRRLGGNVEYTEYDHVGHNSWDRAYAERGLIPWMLAQSRSE